MVQSGSTEMPAKTTHLMRIDLKNVGQIESSTLELGGLTVIGGYNNLGKSTIGKAIFAVIKAVNNSKLESYYEQTQELERINSELEFRLRRSIGRNTYMRHSSFTLYRVSREVEAFFSQSHPKGKKTTQKQIDSFFKNLEKESINFIREDLNNSLRGLSAREKSDLQESDGSDREFIFKQIVSDYLAQVKELYTKEKSEEAERIEAFNRIIRSIFHGEISNKNGGESSINVLSGNEKIISISLEENKALSFTNKADLFPFTDVTLVESPFVLNSSATIIRDALSPNLNASSSKFINYISADIINKLIQASNENIFLQEDLFTTPEQKEFASIYKSLGKTIGGKVYFDKKSTSFVFTNEENLTMPTENIASGIKSLGVTQLLLFAGVLNQNSFLIIDEPEVHLHPEWQIEYAKAIVQIANLGIYVMVSTHSPYMLEALKIYSEKFHLEKITTFYMGKKVRSGSDYVDVTDNLEPLLNQLAIPMQKLSFLK